MKLKTGVAALALATVLFGCRTHMTPEESWASYGHYYTPTGETAASPTGALDLRIVQSAHVQDTVKNLTAQGYVVLGTFKIKDGTEITRPAVTALATKLNAGAVVWSTISTLDVPGALPNPDMGIVGVDKVQMACMNADRPDQSFAEQVIAQQHEIWMLGKKAK